jgi:hypothetical protein
MTCPFCGRDPFHYVDNGLGMEAVAVDCCELGDLYFRGAREPITEDVIIPPDDFRELGARVMGMSCELEAYRAKYGEIFETEPSN